MKRMAYFLVLLASFCFLNSSLTAQIPGLDLLAGHKHQRIYFQYVQGFILIEVKYGLLFPTKFIYDTGAQNTILFNQATASLSPLTIDRQILITGADLSQQIHARIARGAFFKIQDLPIVKRDIIILEEDFLNVQEIIGQKVDGILGSDFFKGLIVEINFKKGYIDIYNAARYNYDRMKDYQKLDAFFNEGKAYVNTLVNIHGKETIQARLLIDTGAALGLLLHNDTHPSLTLPEKTIKGNLGKGISGDLQGYLGKINSFTLGNYQFNNLVTYYQQYNKTVFNDTSKVVRNGIIGNYLLERFNVCLDYSRAGLYFKPNYKNYNEKFRYDKSGLVVFATGENLNDYVINDVLVGSPAYEAGILPGDRIIKIGWRGKSWLSLDKISKLLSEEKNKEIKLKVKRGNQKLTFRFTLRDLI